MASRTILVDGYNLIGWSAGMRASRLESDRERLVSRLARYADARGHRITVIFDGAGAGGRAASRQHPRVTIVYSSSGTKADPWIVDEVRRLHGECVVVTDDRALAMHCEHLDGVVLGCEAFVHLLDAALVPPAAPPPPTATPASQIRPAQSSDREATDFLTLMMEVPEGMAEQKALDEPTPSRPVDRPTRRERHRRSLLNDL